MTLFGVFVFVIVRCFLILQYTPFEFDFITTWYLDAKMKRERHYSLHFAGWLLQ